MKKLIEIIKHTNQLLILVVLVFFIFQYLASVYFHEKPGYNEQIMVIDPPKFLSPKIDFPTIEENIIYKGELGGNHIFYVTRSYSKSMNLDGDEVRLPELKDYRHGSQEYSVNVLFVNQDNSVRKIFEHEVLILDSIIPEFWRNVDYDFTKVYCLFKVISKDSNEDGMITIDDEIDLYATDYLGQNLKILAKNIDQATFDLNVTSHDPKIVVSRTVESGKTFWIYRPLDGSEAKLELKNNP